MRRMGNSKKQNPFTCRNELNVITAQVSAHMHGRENVVITLNVPKKKGLWSGIMQTLIDNDLEVLSASLTTNGETDIHYIHCQLTESCHLENEDQIQSLFDDLILEEFMIWPYKLV